MRNGENRIIYLDYLRVIAMIAIVTIHVSSTNWLYVDVDSYAWIVFNIYDSISRWGVPIFIMISGAVFLGRDDISLKKFF